MFNFLSDSALRPKVINCISKYQSLSERQSLTIGFYYKGELFILGGEEHIPLSYDIGSISKTITAHLILDLVEEGALRLDSCVSDYLALPKGDYPTIYQLLTHTAGYKNLTPVEITVPALLRHGYARKNIYEGCTCERVITCLKKRRRKANVGYSYSDFGYAILAAVAENVTGKSFSGLISNFVKDKLGMTETVISLPKEERYPPAILGGRQIDFWRWEEGNPYIAGGGLVSNVADMLKYISLEIESDLAYIANAHKICKASLSENKNIATCIGWHTYKKSNQLWHVGGVGTFRSSVIFNKKRKLGVVVLGNSKGVASANVHYLAKMLYSEMKINKINFKAVLEDADKI